MGSAYVENQAQYGDWSHQQQQVGFVPSQQYVQPHINPRFASAFGYGFPPQSEFQYDSYDMQNTSGYDQATTQNWADEWTVPVSESSGPRTAPGP
jgi:H/ACA ribonucleoprotein complex non-core subunit NAF1